MSCNCEICQYTDEFYTNLKDIPLEHQKFFEDLFMRYQSECLDNDVNKAIIEGSWPDSDKIIIENHKKAENPLPRDD